MGRGGSPQGYRQIPTKVDNPKKRDNGKAFAELAQGAAGWREFAGQRSVAAGAARIAPMRPLGQSTAVIRANRITGLAKLDRCK
jgi:hypothetical protein